MALLDEYKQALSSAIVPITNNCVVDPQRSNDHIRRAESPAPDPDEEQDIAGSKADLIDLTAKERPGGEHPMIVQTSQFKKPRTTDVGRFDEYALRFLRKLNKDGDDMGTDLVIDSPLIQKALRSIMSSYAFLNLAADPIVIPKPFAPLFHYRKKLLEYTSSAERTEIEKEHMRVLMNAFFEPYMADTQRIFTEEVPKGRVRFEYLWTLFRAEDDVIIHNEHFREIHRVMHCEERLTDDGEVFTIYTWRWGYNAGKFGPCAETITIAKFASTRCIQQLSCFPIKLLRPEEQQKLYRSLIDRGRKWRRLIPPTQMQYRPIWASDTSPRTMRELDIRYSNGRIMLDHEHHAEKFGYLIDQLVGVHGYRLNGREIPDNLTRSSMPAIRISSGGGVRYTSRAGQNKKINFNSAQCFADNEHYNMTDEEALLSPARTRGFSMSEKVTAFFLVDKVIEVDYREKAFDSLILEPGLKSVVQALVMTHDSASTEFDDLVADKGKGVIILLEGPPGSGKTLTAESTAELTHKPLYSISASEQGISAEKAERNLRNIFKRVERWNAILLLDEADLFLTKRSPTELDRNALVTVFLRNMEYFGGLMFLTTNRVEDFDPAFDSRIHLRIPFSSLDAQARAAIWRNFLPHQTGSDLSERLGQELEINGREIKNLMRTSQLIAKYNDVPLSEDFIKDLYRTNHGNR